MSESFVVGLINREMARRGPLFDPGRRWSHFDEFNKRPLLVAEKDPATVNQAAMRIYSAGHNEFLLSGTGAVAASAAFLAGSAGVILTAEAGGANNTSNVFPGQLGGAAEFGILNLMQMQPQKEPFFQLVFTAGPAVTTTRFIFGFRLTAPATADETTDNDFAAFAFNPATSLKWRGISKVAGGAVQTVTGGQLADVTGLTKYRLAIQVNTQRQAVFYVNDLPIGSSAPLTANAAFKPVLTIQTLSTAARLCTLHSLMLSRLH